MRSGKDFTAAAASSGSNGRRVLLLPFTVTQTPSPYRTEFQALRKFSGSRADNQGDLVSPPSAWKAWKTLADSEGRVLPGLRVVCERCAHAFCARSLDSLG